jgi:hypothetical protein
VDYGQHRVSEKTAQGSGYRFKLLAAAIFAVSAAAYIAYEPASLSLDSLIGMLSGSSCSQDQGSCTPVAASADGQQGSGTSAGTSHQRQRAIKPRALTDDSVNTRSLRFGYTIAELCQAGLADNPYRCQTGSYDGTFIASEPGATAPSVAAKVAASGAAISGRVLTTEGVGIGGVTIVAAPERITGQQVPDSGTLRFWTVTDSLGAYSLDGIPDGEYTIRSQTHGPFPSARISARSGVDYADLVVSPDLAAVAEGRVLGADGEPLEGVTVLPVLPGQPSVLTGDDGRFRLPVRVKPTVSSFALRFQRPGYHEQTDKFEIPRDGASNRVAMKVVLQPVEAWTALKGKVLSDSGEPLAGRTVELRPESAPRSYKTTTDPRGRYAFSVVESPADYQLIVFGGASHKDHQQSLHVTADMGELDVVAEAYEFGEVTGQLVNLSGEPVPDFALLLRNSGSRQPNSVVSTDKDGNFKIPAAPVGKFVVASQSTPSILVEGLELKAGDKLHLPLVLDWGQHEIRGVVVDAAGNPVPASRIVLQWSHESDGITTRTTRRTAADTQGQFAFSQLGPGAHSLKIDGAGFPAVVVNHDVSRQGNNLTVRLN